MLSSGDKYWTEVDAKDKYWTCLGQKLGLKVIFWTNTWHGHFQDIWRTFAGHILAWDKVRTNVGILTMSTSTLIFTAAASELDGVVVHLFGARAVGGARAGLESGELPATARLGRRVHER